MTPAKNRVLKVLAVLIGITMVVPTTLLVGGLDHATTDSASMPKDYYTVLFSNPAQKEKLVASGVDIVKLNDWGAVVKMTAGLKADMSTDYEVNALPDRTMVKMPEVGVSFDSRTGYTVPDEWKADSSSLYMVQFVAPADESWTNEVKGIATSCFSMIGDNLIIVRLTPAQKADIDQLPYVEWSGIYQPYFKAYELVRQQTGGDVSLIISPFDTSIEQLALELIAFGATQTELDYSTMTVHATVDAAAIPLLAKMESVGLIDYWGPKATTNNKGNEIVQSYYVWDNRNYSHLPVNITGFGQRIDIQDTRLDGTHRDFTLPRTRIIFNQASVSTEDHGTHTTSCAAGSGYDMEMYLGLNAANSNYYEIAASSPIGYPDRRGFAGRAPEAGIVFYEGLVSTEWATAYTTYAARVFTNSWGDGTVTTGYTNVPDNFMVAQPLGLILFSAGNDGPNQQTVGRYENSKMGLGVGASENMRADQFDSEDNPNQLADFSSRGPPAAADLRIKPDLVEIGTATFGAKGDFVTNANGEPVYKGSNENAALMINNDPDAAGDYVNYQGTSMSCPHAAGDAILVRDYLEDIALIPTASIEPILIKAMLIQGCEDMGFGFPSYDQGWGRINVENSIVPPAPASNKFWDRTTGSLSQTVNVLSDDVPLKVTMAQRDSAFASATLTTDYDLTVTAPNGTWVYQGNLFANSESVGAATAAAGTWASAAFPPTGRVGATVGNANSAYDWDTANDYGDDINTVEVVIVPKPVPGTWWINVTQKSGGAIWACVATADFGANATMTYSPELTADLPRQVPLYDGWGYATITAGAGTQACYGFWVQNSGSSTDTITLSSTQPSGWSVSFVSESLASMPSWKRTHVLAYVTAPATATAGTYVINITGTSGGNTSRFSVVSFNVDIVTERMPIKTRFTTYALSDNQPQMLSFNQNGTNYVIVAYRRDTGMGDRVYAQVSADGGATFGAPIQLQTEALSPTFLQIARKNTGVGYNNRTFVSWSGYKAKVAGDGDLTTYYRVQVAYADPPYTTWTLVTPFTGGEGSAAVANANSYRCTFMATYLEEVHLIVEDMEYDGTDLNTANLAGVSTIEKRSTNGGATWTAWSQVDPNAALTYYFFPSGYTDTSDGSIVLWYYWRTSTGTTRDLLFQRYNGAWGAGITAWDVTDNVLFPRGANTPDGSNYCTVNKGALSDAPKNVYAVFTDNDGGAFTTGRGPINSTTLIVDDSKYGNRNVLDMDVTTEADPFVWSSFGENGRNSTFKQVNFYAFRSRDSAGYNTGTIFGTPITQDSFTKEHFSASSLGTRLNYIYCTNAQNNNVDLYMTTFDHDWKNASDTTGPITTNTNVDYLVANLTAGQTAITIGANVNDWSTGGSNIATAQYRIDNGTTTTAAAADGVYGSVSEGVKQTAVSIASLSAGFHWVEVRGQDSAGNWGAWTGVVIEVVIWGSGPQWYPWINITVVAGWNLVSVPYVGPTPLPGALQDMANGGAGLVVWDRVQAYSPFTPTNLWQQYNTGWGAALNDLSTVNNSVGVWINVVTVGDGLICLGGSAYSNATSTPIPLAIGWNLIGFPSDDPAYTVATFKADCGGLVTIVEGFNGAATYKTAAMLDADLMTMGKAYWVYASSPTTWTKPW
ncbi:MAG: S8 family serine peptidase [Euryarchaeota archaeon]|nr:S8 family serine peptidase [Euryarchaeota archaeon]